MQPYAAAQNLQYRLKVSQSGRLLDPPGEPLNEKKINKKNDDEDVLVTSKVVEEMVEVMEVINQNASKRQCHKVWTSYGIGRNLINFLTPLE